IVHRRSTMGEQLIIVAIFAACAIGLFVHYRKSVKSKSCSCCGSGGGKKSSSVCHCHDKR
ncbi:MAG: hypothetical protein Q4F72_07335, partial [Desulfovibrionaceae bacterium]|nr:hypothetical protein [Desulfovibrionaceae bacterium]